MIKTDFLEVLKAFTEEAVSQMLLPVKTEGDVPQLEKPTAVYRMRLPDSRLPDRYAPYIIHRIISAEDGQSSGEASTSSLVLQSIFCVYSKDEQEGSLLLLELMERYRIALLQQRLIASRYLLDLESGPMQTFLYPDATAPYYAGEITSNWQIPPIERNVVWPENR